MTRESTSQERRVQDLNLKCFQIRQKAKFCVCLIMILQTLMRLAGILWDKNLTPKAIMMILASLSFALTMIIVILLEYFFFKKIGPKIVRYSKVVDLILLTSFLGDWLINLISGFFEGGRSHPISFKPGAAYGIIGFAWRTLLVTLIVQKWQLKIIAPVVASSVITGFIIYYARGGVVFLVLRAVVQISCIILIIYGEDKVKWRLMRTNVEQEKWMQVNNFILDNIPENIMILDMENREETKFMSSYCKSFLKKWNFTMDPRDFFKNVRNLQQQEQGEDNSPSESIIQVERLTTWNGLFVNPVEYGSENVETLEDLVTDFKNIKIQKNLKEREFLVFNGKLKLGENQNKSIEMKISFIHHFENDYIILIFRDTTQRDRLIALEETNKYKDQLLASVSHELRAPLNGNINLVESAIGSAKVCESVKKTLLIPALRSSKFLLHIINDILDMSQIKEKKLRLVFELGDLKKTLKSATQLVELQAKKKGIDLILELDSQLPKNFSTDHLRVSQIVLNLLTNAMKFTRKGFVKLIAKSANDDGSWVKVSVEDSGVGMTQENLNRLFSSSSSIDIERRQATGIGLGLNIASHLVQLLSPEGHQNLDVVTIPNQGSIFSFIIQNQGEIEEIDNSNEVADELSGVKHPIISSKSSSVLQKKICSCPKVLIVDDNPFNTMALETILNSLGVKCDAVYSGLACIQKLLNRQTKTCGAPNCQPHSVIFMDQEMPEMSGVETVHEIKRLQNENLIPLTKIIGCTAQKGKHEVDLFLASGLDECIFKPVSKIMIKETLKEILVK